MTPETATTGGAMTSSDSASTRGDSALTQPRTEHAAHTAHVPTARAALARGTVELEGRGRVDVRATKRERTLDVNVSANDVTVAQVLMEQAPRLSRELDGLGEVRLTVDAGGTGGSSGGARDPNEERFATIAREAVEPEAHRIPASTPDDARPRGRARFVL